MSMSSNRPCRERRQPTRNKDKIELNMELIEKLENSKVYKGTNASSSSNAKILVTFINSINQSSREFQNSGREQQGQSKKLTEEDHKNVQPYSSVMIKRSKLNNGKVGEYPVENIKNQDKKMQKHINPNNSACSHKNRMPNPLYSKKEPQKFIPTLKSKPQKPEIEKVLVDKKFKRHSYHIAIAYKIHLDKINAQHTGICDPIRYDPTYPARKLKQEQTVAPQ